MPSKFFYLHIKKTSFLRSFFLVLCFCFFAQSTFAKEPAYDIKQLKEKAQRLALWENTTWLALLHYNRGGTIRDRNQSYADSTEFFLAKDGKSNPKNELLASIDTLFSNANKRCTFVARYRFLHEKLIGNNWKQNLETCTQYNAFIKNTTHDSIFLIFPGAYLSAPSSMFGHTLLRIGPKNTDSSQAMLSNAITFGANVPNDVHPATYIGAGLFGGFPGFYNILPYFSKIQEYNNEESRDIWEFELNLKKDEILNLLQHLWEVKNIRFDYFYLDENCSYRLLELLSVVRPEESWIHTLRFAELPLNSIRAVEKAGLLKQTQWRPSNFSKVKAQLQQLNESQRQWVLGLQSNLTSPHQQLNQKQQAQSLNTAYELYRFNNRKTWRQKEVSQHGLELLKLRAKLPNFKQQAIIAPANPQNAHLSRRTSVAWQKIRNRSGVNLGLRYAYHDLLDAPLAFDQGFELEALNLNLFLDQKNETMYFKNLDLVNVSSFNNSNAFVKPWSWQFNIGINNNIQENRLSFSVGGGLGTTTEISKSLQAYALATAKANYLESDGAHLITGYKLGALLQSKNVSGKLEWQHDLFSTKVDHKAAKLSGQFQYHLNSRWGVRLESAQTYDKDLKRKNSTAWSLGANYYY